MPSLYLRLAAYAVAVAACIGIGWYLGGLSPKAALAALQAQDWQAKQQATQVALTAVQAQLKEAQTVAANNSTVIQGLQNDNAKIAADRDANLVLAHRLLNLAKTAPGASGGNLSKASDQPATSGPSGNSGTGQVEGMVADAADESASCAISYNALLAQLKPQL